MLHSHTKTATKGSVQAKKNL
uniref:Uncharacterized protein n=1 Tax=Arundo donax TaxID=35708 RepID=A0A0A9AXG8_ARUDO